MLKTRQDHLREAEARLRPLLEQAAAVPGAMSAMAAMQRFDAASRGSSLCRLADPVVHLTTSNSAK